MVVLFDWIPLMVVNPVPQSKQDWHLFTRLLTRTTLAGHLEKRICDAILTTNDEHAHSKTEASYKKMVAIIQTFKEA